MASLEEKMAETQDGCVILKVPGGKDLFAELDEQRTRDMFAAHAMAGFAHRIDLDNSCPEAADYAHAAFIIADAMMAERARRLGEAKDMGGPA